MAEGKTLEQMEKEITCAVCQEHYTEPKVLPCLHYYCKECVLKLALRTASNKPFSCPECRKDIILPEGGVEELKTAFFVNRYKSNYYALERVHGKVEVKCEGCSDSGAKAEAFCRQCVTFICKECVKIHKKLKAYGSHEVDSLGDLKQGRAREIAKKKPPTEKCLTHKEPLVIYCFDCNSLICRDCTVKVHRDHNFEFSQISAPETKESLRHKVSVLKEISSSLFKGIEEISDTKQEVEAQGNSVADTINTSFNQLHLILEERKQKLLQESAKTVQEKIDKLTVQEKNLSLAHAEVQSITDYTERFVSDCSDNEVMSMHTEIKKRIEQEIEEQSQSGRNTEPVEEADMGVEVGCVEALQQLCQTKAKITRLAIDPEDKAKISRLAIDPEDKAKITRLAIDPEDKAKITRLAIDPAHCAVRGEGAESAMVNQITSLTVLTRLANNKITRRSTCRVTGQLKSLCEGLVVECEVEPSGLGEYRIQYTPTVRGRHELTVSVDGQQVAGSPFPVSVSIHSTQLGKPVKVWRRLREPTDVVSNSTGELVVAEYNGHILKLHEDGTKRTLVNRSTSGLSKPCSLATDEEDNIYCTCLDTNKIMRCDKNGDNVHVYKVEQVKGQGHMGVAVLGDEVLVCERYNEGTIMVYDRRDFKYLRRIVHKESGTLIRISTDSHSNIYATNGSKRMVRVFNKDGVILRSFGCGDNGVKLMRSPWGICVSGQFVYVTNVKGHNVSVFTTAGDYVTSFGQLGDGDGEFRNPWGITVNVNNFIYVTDVHGRVQCF